MTTVPLDLHPHPKHAENTKEKEKSVMHVIRAIFFSSENSTFVSFGRVASTAMFEEEEEERM